MDAVASGLDWGATLWWCGGTLLVGCVMVALESLISWSVHPFMRGGRRRFALASGLQMLITLPIVWLAPLALDLIDRYGLPFGISAAAYWLGGPVLLIGLAMIVSPQARALIRDYWSARWRSSWRSARGWKRREPLNLSAG